MTGLSPPTLTAALLDDEYPRQFGNVMPPDRSPQRQLGEYIAHQCRLRRRNHAVTADQAVALDGEKIGGGVSVELVDVAAVRAPQRLPAAFFHINFVAQAKIIVEQIFVEFSVVAVDDVDLDHCDRVLRPSRSRSLKLPGAGY